MIEIRKANERGHFDFDWLQTYHSFSFGEYYDPKQMGFRALRVINEDFVQPGRGFGTHGHKDMEIITYVLEGSLAHKDNLGNGSAITPGEVQRMSAGTGVLHSEFNHSQDQPVHLLQIWIEPNQLGVKPGYEQKRFETAALSGKLRLIASPDGQDDSTTIHQDARVYSTILDQQQVVHDLGADRHAWVQVARGKVNLNGIDLNAGDGAALTGETRVSLNATGTAEVLLFDLA